MDKSIQRGFILLTVILLAVIAVMIVMGRRHSTTETMIDSLQAYEDSLVTQYERHQEEKRQEFESRRQGGFRSQQRRQDAFYEAATVRPRDTVVRENAYRPRPVLLFDLNEADTTDLQQLRGIGPVFARRIVRYRDRLGGFVCKEQLFEVKGMTDTLYNKISPYLTLEQPEVKKLNINSATLDVLKRHAYLDYYKAKAIVKYRQQVGAFRETQDLLKISLIDQETYQKLLPYIEL